MSNKGGKTEETCMWWDEHKEMSPLRVLTSEPRRQRLEEWERTKKPVAQRCGAEPSTQFKCLEKSSRGFQPCEQHQLCAGDVRNVSLSVGSFLKRQHLINSNLQCYAVMLLINLVNITQVTKHLKVLTNRVCSSCLVLFIFFKLNTSA